MLLDKVFRPMYQQVASFPGLHAQLLSLKAWHEGLGMRLPTCLPSPFAQLWSTETGKCYHTFRGHSGEIVCLGFNPSSTLVATGSMDTTAKLWSVETGAEQCTLSVSGGGYKGRWRKVRGGWGGYEGRWGEEGVEEGMRGGGERKMVEGRWGEENGGGEVQDAWYEGRWRKAREVKGVEGYEGSWEPSG